MCFRKLNCWIMVLSLLGLNAQANPSGQSQTGKTAEQSSLAVIADQAIAKANAYKKESQATIDQAITRSKAYEKDARLLVGQVEHRIEALKFKEETSDKLANDKGVNIDLLLSKYFHKYQQGKEEQQKIPELMVFVSLSMPEKGLIELGEQAAKAGGVLVLRGMHENSLQKTIGKIHKLSAKGIPAIIHPKLFKQFGVSVVPVIALVDRENALCLKAESNCTPVADKVTGNVTLHHALQLFAGSGDYQLKAREYLNKTGGKG